MGLYVMMIVIYFRWEMDEKVRIFWICVWFSFIYFFRVVERMVMVVRRVGFREGEVMKRSVMGGSFMVVDRMSLVVRGDFCRIFGN